MLYYEWSVADDYPDDSLSLRFMEGQMHCGLELMTADIYSSMQTPPTQIIYRALSPNACRLIVDGEYNIVHAPGGILVSKSIRSRIDKVAPGEIQWIMASVVDALGKACAQLVLAVPMFQVKALDLSRTRQIPMPGGAKLPIAPYFYVADELNLHNIMRVNLGSIVISEWVRHALSGEAGFYAKPCKM
jgi:hypothetical protein